MERSALNKFVILNYQRLKLGGGYLWKDGDGVPFDVFYRTLQAGKADGTTFCCGVTYWIWMKACEQWCIEHRLPFYVGMNEKEMKLFKKLFYVAVKDLRRGCVDALEHFKLGRSVPVQEAQDGDFIQLWRPNGSGHSAIVVSIAGQSIKYFSTQKSTDGIGYRTESLSSLSEIYIARAVEPIKLMEHPILKTVDVPIAPIPHLKISTLDKISAVLERAVEQIITGELSIGAVVKLPKQLAWAAGLIAVLIALLKLL